MDHIGLVLQVGDAEKFPHALCFKSLDRVFRVSKQGPCFTAIEEMEMKRDLYSLKLLAMLIVLQRQILFSLATATIAEAILMQTFAENVPSLHRVAPRYWKLVTSTNFWPFMLISALMLFVQLVMILLFSVLASIPYAVALSTSPLVRS